MEASVSSLHYLHRNCQGCIPLKSLPGKPVQWEEYCTSIGKISGSTCHCYWLAPCLQPHMLVFSFLIYEETSRSIYLTTVNGQSSSTEKKKRRFLVSSWVVYISVFLGVFCLSSNVPRVFRRSSIWFTAFSGTHDCYLLNRTQNSSDQCHSIVTIGQNTLYSLSYSFIFHDTIIRNIQVCNN